ncbi:hypothetical protein QJR26_18730 (plasmid) [Clostridium baratii]
MRGSKKEILCKDKNIENICNLYKMGLTNTQIAEELNMTLENVKSYMKRYIRIRADYSYINQLHNINKKKLKEEEQMRKRIIETAKREIASKVGQIINTETLVRKCCNSAYEYKKGTYVYKYDKNTRPADLPQRFSV